MSDQGLPLDTAPLRLLAGVLDHAQLLVALLDPQFRYVWVNRAYADACGQTPDAFPGQSYFQLQPQVAPLDLLQRVLDTGQPLSAAAERVAFPARLASDPTCWTWTVSPLTDGDGPVTGLALTLADVSRQARVEAELRASEDRYRVLFEESPYGALIIDAVTGAFLEFNTTAHRQLGYSREEFARLSVIDVEAQESPEEVRAHIAEVTRRGRAEFETRHRTRQGDIRHVHVTAQIVSVRGQPVFHAVWHDITARKQAEAQLAAANLALTATLDALPDMLFEVDADARIYDYRAPAPLLLYVAPEVFLGKRMDEVLPPEPSRIINQALAEAKATGHHQGATYCLDVPARPASWFELSIAAKGRPGDTPARFVLLVRDITARKQAETALRESEEKFRNLVDCSPMGMHLYRLDPDGRVRLVGANPTADRILGLDHRPLLGRAVDEAFPDLKGTDVPRVYRYVATGELGPQSFDIPHREANRSAILEVHAFRTGPAAMAAAFLDVTNRKRMEEQLIQVRKMESIGRLAGGVAHDFNNMLAVILGNVTLALANLPPTHAIRGDLEEIERCARRSAELTRQLLAFARKQTVSPRVIDLNATIQDLLRMLRRLIGEGIGLDWTPSPNLWPVRVDPTQIVQILVNLCGNARDAIADLGHVTLETSNVTFDAAAAAGYPGSVPGDYVLLAVTDNGCGMEPGVLDRLFEPFFTTKAVGQGTGLGLAIVYGIVKQNAGFIHVTSEAGRGTTFRIYLPRHAQETAPSSPTPPAPPTVQGRETLLLVEDKPPVLRMTWRVLEALGYSVLAVASPTDALCLAQTHLEPIDLLLTDVVMPEMNGFELARRLQAIRPGLKCLFMSGYSADAIAEAGPLAPGTLVLEKPFTVQSLATAVRQAIGRA